VPNLSEHKFLGGLAGVAIAVGIGEKWRGDNSIVVRGSHLRRVAALLKECGALVSNDTGLMHIAAALGIPVVVILVPRRRISICRKVLMRVWDLNRNVSTAGAAWGAVTFSV
jgi:ADP-heptose:LPS heptosyltransferase